MADYISQFTGSEIDQRLAKVPQLESGKQDKLVSGSNIKTINGQSVLGSGDMQIQAGDTDAVKYVAQTLTDAQKAQARTNVGAGTYSKPSSGIPASDIASGVIPDVSGKQDTLVSGTNIKTINSESILGQGDIRVGIIGVDSEDVQDIEETLAAVALKKTQQTLTSAEKAQVWENLGLDDISGKADKILVANSVPVGGMRPNTFYNLGTLTGSVSIEFSAAPDNTIYNEWMFQFETGSAAPTITWPAAITSWLGGSAPTINTYKKYQVSVVNGLAVIGDF